jgi:receptor expression-enhancing protein 5/6
MALQRYRDQVEKFLHEKNAVTDLLATVEKKTGAPRLYVACGVTAFTMIWLVYGWGAQLLCNLIGFIYPAMTSIKAIESRNKEDDTKWLTYWVVFALFSLLEFFSDILLSWFPIYWLAKCAFLIWCYAPGSLNGSHMIYHKIIRPFFLKHESVIDTAADKIRDAAKNAAHNIGDKLE